MNRIALKSMTVLACMAWLFWFVTMSDTMGRVAQWLAE